MKAWVLVDERIGNSNQAKALAKLLNVDYEEKFIKYSLWANIPYICAKLILKNILDLNINESLPDVVISCGRRASKIALMLAKRHPIKLIQILQPEASYKKFDVVLLPFHDKKHNSYPVNVLFFNTAFAMPFDEVKTKYWHGLIENFQPPFIAVLLGGNSRKCVYNNNAIDKLCILLVNMATKNNATLLITASRRSPQHMVNNLILKLKQANIRYLIYSPNDTCENPYSLFLQKAQQIVVTGDSISMISEACATDKKVYIYVNKQILPKKHYKFCSYLINRRIAKYLGDEDDFTPVIRRNELTLLLNNIRKRI